MLKVANVATVGSGASAGTAWFADVEPVVAFVAACFAVISGAFAIWYYIEKIRLTRKQRKKL